MSVTSFEITQMQTMVPFGWLIGPIAFLFFTSVGVALFFSSMTAMEGIGGQESFDEVDDSASMTSTTWRLIVDQIVGDTGNRSTGGSSKSGRVLRGSRRRRRLLNLKCRQEADHRSPSPPSETTPTANTADPDVVSSDQKSATEAADLPKINQPDNDASTDVVTPSKNDERQQQQQQRKAAMTRRLAETSPRTGSSSARDDLVLDVLINRRRRRSLLDGPASSPSSAGAGLVTWFAALAANEAKQCPVPGRRRSTTTGTTTTETELFRWTLGVDEEFYPDFDDQSMPPASSSSPDRRGRASVRRRHDYVISFEKTTVVEMMKDSGSGVEQAAVDVAAAAVMSSTDNDEDDDLDADLRFEFDRDDNNDADDDNTDVEEMDLMAELQRYLDSVHHDEDAHRVNQQLD